MSRCDVSPPLSSVRPVTDSGLLTTHCCGDGGHSRTPLIHDMSPTVFRVGPYRFFFFSREDPRIRKLIMERDEQIREAWTKHFGT